MKKGISAMEGDVSCLWGRQDLRPCSQGRGGKSRLLGRRFEGAGCDEGGDGIKEGVLRKKKGLFSGPAELGGEHAG